MTRRGWSIVLGRFLALAACTPATPPPSPLVLEPQAEGSLPEPVPTIPPRATVIAEAVECGWGSVGVVSLDAPIPYWVIGVVEVQSSERIDGLELVQIELRGADGKTRGGGDRERELRLAGRDRGRGDFSRHATVPFDGALIPGSRNHLWFHVRLDDAFEKRTRPPTEYTLTLRTAGGSEVQLTGPVGSQWPTG